MIPVPFSLPSSDFTDVSIPWVKFRVVYEGNGSLNHLSLVANVMKLLDGDSLAYGGIDKQIVVTLDYNEVQRLVFDLSYWLILERSDIK